MAYVELVIKVPEESYEFAKECKSKGSSRHSWTLTYNNIVFMIANGIPLPKGHGDLKDVDKIISDGISKGFCDWYDEMKHASTIIEADKAESQEQKPYENKVIEEHYKKGFSNGIRTAERRYNNAITEIREHADRLKDSLYGDGLRHALEIIDKYKSEESVE